MSPPTTGALISVVIPAHNAAAVLGDQLRALSDQQHPPQFEVVVVLNRCTDETGRVAERFRDRLQLVVVRADERASAAHARNVGIHHARGDVVLFCDADDCVGPTWVSALATTIRDGGADYAGGAVVVDRTGLPAWAYMRFYSWIDGLYLKPPTSGIERPVGGSLAVRSFALREVGGFDEELSASEDSDLTIRLLRSGYRLGIASDALLTVRPRATVKSLIRQQRAHAQGSAQLLAKESRLPAPPSRGPAVVHSIKWLANQVVREGKRDPAELLVLTAARRSNDRARREVWQRRVDSGEPPNEAITEEEFVVPPEAPIIGGLGFRVAEADRHWWATEGVEPRSLRSVGALLRPGVNVLEITAEIGVYAVHAARAVGRAGRVYAIEENEAQRQRLLENVRRHGVDHTVELLPSAHDAAEPPVEEEAGPSAARLLARLGTPIALLAISMSDLRPKESKLARELIEENRDCAVHLRFRSSSSLDVASLALDIVAAASPRVAFAQIAHRADADLCPSSSVPADVLELISSGGTMVLVHSDHAVRLAGGSL